MFIFILTFSFRVQIDTYVWFPLYKMIAKTNGVTFYYVIHEYLTCDDDDIIVMSSSNIKNLNYKKIYVKDYILFIFIKVILYKDNIYILKNYHII